MGKKHASKKDVSSVVRKMIESMVGVKCKSFRLSCKICRIWLRYESLYGIEPIISETLEEALSGHMRRYERE